MDERERFLTRELLRSLDLGEEWLQFVGLVEANLGQLFLISANGRSEDVGGFEDDTNTACFSVGTNSRIKRLAVWPEKRGCGEVECDAMLCAFRFRSPTTARTREGVIEALRLSA